LAFSLLVVVFDNFTACRCASRPQRKNARRIHQPTNHDVLHEEGEEYQENSIRAETGKNKKMQNAEGGTNLKRNNDQIPCPPAQGTPYPAAQGSWGRQSW